MIGKGIAVAGNILVDRINEINKYPQISELTKILNVKLAAGGCVPNVAIDLARLDPTLYVCAIGKVGRDSDGEFAVSIMKDNGVDVSHIVSCDTQTSFTEVMSEISGQRTFFTYLGANAEFGYDDIDFEKLDVKMLHLGYFLLLEKVDNGDGEKILRRASEMGIETSIDLVSENSDRYSLIRPCLKYVDNLIINEIEAGKLADVEPKLENLELIAKKLLSQGVRKRVIIHEKNLGIVVSRENGTTVLPAYDLPRSYIKGTTGAGDAFCAGALLGIYEGRSDEEILELASISAMGSLSEADAISGMKSREELQQTVASMGLKRCKLV